MFNSLKTQLKFIIVSIFFVSSCLNAAMIRNGGNLQMGDNVTEFCLAKILSMKYGITFYHSKFPHHQLFMLDNLEQKWPDDMKDPARVIAVSSDQDVIAHKDQNVLLYSTVTTRVNFVSPEEFAVIKRDFQLKENPPVKPLPEGVISVGVHIRRGNGGGAHYDGEVSSQQLFDYNRSQVWYRTDFESLPFDYEGYERRGGYLIRSRISVDRVPGWETRFPPLQFYIDQIIKLSDDLGNPPLFVSICTDDKQPELLIQTIKQAINKPNIIIDYEDYRNLSYTDRVWRDLYILSRADVMIRPQSNFSRTAELIGNHKLVIYPLVHHWDGNRLIMTQVVLNGSLKSLRIN